MKHGKFHNQNCKYCRAIDLTVIALVSMLALFAELMLVVNKLDLPTKEQLAGLTAVMLGYILGMLLWVPLRVLVPQTHGVLLDATNNINWYKPMEEE